MQRIIVSVTNDLVTDQRVHRVCTTLVEMGYDILLIGRKLPGSIPLERNYSIKRIHLFFNKGFLFYAEYNIRLFFKLLFSKKDILLSNDLDTLLPNFLVSKLLNKKLVFDSHELFSEIPELVDRPRVKWFWKRLEKWMIPKLRNCYTVSESITNYYKCKYGTNFKLIRNFPIKEVPMPAKTSLQGIEEKKVILYQGAVNIGRGLELMIETMPFIKNAIFVIAGDGDILEELRSKVMKDNIEDKVWFLGRLSPEELKEITRIATIGISLEEDMGLNYRYALSNKLFDYIQARVPVLVSDLPEMKKLVEEFDVGIVLKERAPETLANMINVIIEKDKDKWQNQLKKAANELIWQKESVKLKALFQSLK